jgi:ATP-binding cassette subfamily F protein uup
LKPATTPSLTRIWRRKKSGFVKGSEARRTRNEGRVRALMALREERRQRREQLGKASFALEQAETSGKLVIEAKNVRYAWRTSR